MLSSLVVCLDGRGVGADDDDALQAATAVVAVAVATTIAATAAAAAAKTLGVPNRGRLFRLQLTWFSLSAIINEMYTFGGRLQCE